MCQSMENCACGSDRVCAAAAFTPTGHIVGMLDRDQRTAKIPTYCKSSECTLQADAERIIHTKSTRFSRTNLLWKTIQRLKQVLVVGTYLLCVVSIPRSLSAPMDSGMGTHPMWVDPCGYTKNREAGVEGYSEEQPLSSLDLAMNIKTQAQIALGEANTFKADFGMKMLHDNLHNLDEMFGKQHYDWLPQTEDLLANLDERIEENVSETFDEVLLSVYEHLQTYAAGIEQIMLDQKAQRNQFLPRFIITERQLHSLLCEIQFAIVERNLAQRPDIKRDIMTKTFRLMMDDTQRNLRDWLIYKDYLNALESTQKAFVRLVEAFSATNGDRS